MLKERVLVSSLCSRSCLPGERVEDVLIFLSSCAEDEKFLLIYVIFKLKLIKGKTIIFVADIDRCYRLKLYLEQFGIKSCILNSELPVNRCEPQNNTA